RSPLRQGRSPQQVHELLAGDRPVRGENDAHVCWIQGVGSLRRRTPTFEEERLPAAFLSIHWTSRAAHSPPAGRSNAPPRRNGGPSELPRHPCARRGNRRTTRATASRSLRSSCEPSQLVPGTTKARQASPQVSWNSALVRGSRSE